MTTQQRTKTVNGIDTGVLKETTGAIEGDPSLGAAKFRLRNKWIGGNQNRSTVEGFYGARQEMQHKQPFELSADEPPVLAGADEYANPVEHLLHALAACVTTSMVAHAAARGIEIQELECEVEGEIDLRGYLGLSTDVPRGYQHIRVRFKVKADEQNLDRLKRLAEFSPVFNTIRSGAKVDIEVEAK